MHLNKTAYQTYCKLSKETRESYSDVIVNGFNQWISKNSEELSFVRQLKQ